MIIVNSSKKVALAISISKDAGMRPIEVTGSRLNNVDVANGLVRPSITRPGSAQFLKIKSSAHAYVLLPESVLQRVRALLDSDFDRFFRSEYPAVFPSKASRYAPRKS
jgi:hypothetical protein